jgi:uncharacterized protein (TIGR02186 family)
MWINTEQVEVDRAPTFYAVASSGLWEATISYAEDLRHKVSVARTIREEGGNLKDLQSFIDALIRLRLQSDLYQININTVEIAKATLFRTSVTLPDNLTEGYYTVRYFLMRNGQVVDTLETSIFVQKVGLQRYIFSLAHEAPLIYGLISIATALAAGWGASALFRIF